MLSAFASAFRTPDLRRKLLFVLAMISIYRLGSVVPVPGVDYTAVQRCVTLVQNNDLYSLINLFSGGALLQLSVFALGIMPYITASIILQLLAVVIPRLEKLRKEGQAGQAKITQYTRYLTIGLAVLQSASLRLRPILMTTGAMVLGALPLAIATGAGAEARHQIGWMIVGGMSFGTLFTLFVVPVVYLLLAGKHRRVAEDDAVAAPAPV